jgi:Polyphosphate kinase N-terminal domain
MPASLSRAPLVDNRSVAKPVPKPKHARRHSAGARIMNRELSTLALNQRVLDLASDPEQPLLERVRY